MKETNKQTGIAQISGNNCTKTHSFWKAKKRDQNMFSRFIFCWNLAKEFTVARKLDSGQISLIKHRNLGIGKILHLICIIWKFIVKLSVCYGTSVCQIFSGGMRKKKKDYLYFWEGHKNLPFSWITLRGKHCRHPIAVMGVVDMFVHYLPYFIIYSSLIILYPPWFFWKSG